MKFLILLPALLSAQWNFTKDDLANYSKSQMECLNVSYFVGDIHTKESKTKYDYGILLAAKAVVETQGGKIQGKSNQICGCHQIDTKYVPGVSCKVLKDNPYVSAKLALDNFLGWKVKYNSKGEVSGYRSDEKATKMFNVGYTNNPFQEEYWRRIKIAYKVLEESI